MIVIRIRVEVLIYNFYNFVVKLMDMLMTRDLIVTNFVALTVAVVLQLYQ